jgi:hypothetical protein
MNFRQLSWLCSLLIKIVFLLESDAMRVRFNALENSSEGTARCGTFLVCFGSFFSNSQIMLGEGVRMLQNERLDGRRTLLMDVLVGFAAILSGNSSFGRIGVLKIILLIKLGKANLYPFITFIRAPSEAKEKRSVSSPKINFRTD